MHLFSNNLLISGVSEQVKEEGILMAKLGWNPR